MGAKLYLMGNDGKHYELIKVGAPGDWMEGYPVNAKCGDCGSRMGEYHKMYCDIQRCPICGGQLLSCEHGDLKLYNPRHTGVKR